MSVTVENLENLERKVVLSLPWSEINAETDKRLQQTQRRVKIDGFRPGKAPLKMVASMYGSSVQNDVMNELVQKAFYDVAVAQNLKVAGMPRFEGVEEQEDKDSFKVAAVFEVFPEVKVGDLSAQEIEKVTAEVGDAEVDKTIEILRKQRTRFNHVEREAQNGDRVIIDFEGKIDGVVFDGGSAKNYPFVLGNGQMLPEFEAGVLGLKEGESKEVEVNFPEDYHGKDVAGKTAVFTISVRNVSEATLPEVDGQFAKALGIEDGDVAKMREEVKKNVAREVVRRTKDQTKEAVMEALLKVTDIQLPKVLVAEEAARLAAEMKQNFVNQGMADAAKLDLPADMFNEQAERRVALGLILAQLVDENKLEPSEEQVKAIVSDFAESYEDPQEVIDWYFSDRQRLQGPTSLAVEANVVEFVLGKAKVNEKVLSFDEVMGAQA
ncbi:MULTISPECIES: trigger factor [unclassified Neisseria]|uniref:trigger factor n=1 Tax=unclassified Neisseria TaxID=2623750 RepID=UPI002665D065|nr:MULTISPECIES: trigger factor [unclassified Neisseria]MDO1510185.1 trigger factor [Neisseria sp. MVDL19-042950]MDO1516761.1 trigger factor [Neisseria sp. MVDL18-041461]MDO1563908.1 trigger factor [Neisseria sp. MVDL20-010259]